MEAGYTFGTRKGRIRSVKNYSSNKSVTAGVEIRSCARYLSEELLASYNRKIDALHLRSSTTPCKTSSLEHHYIFLTTLCATSLITFCKGFEERQVQGIVSTKFLSRPWKDLQGEPIFIMLEQLQFDAATRLRPRPGPANYCDQ